jgi:fido (protein-threonine AMPylation protein)
MALKAATTAKILNAISDLESSGRALVTSTQIFEKLDRKISHATIKRYLEALVEDEKKLTRTGQTRSTRYSLRKDAAQTAAGTPAQALLDHLRLPLGSRDPVGYKRAFVDGYSPNASVLLPRELADELLAAGRLKGQQPAGTYARKVLEELLVDLAWSSSRLEGNQYSKLATEELFKLGEASGDTDAVMLLNHKRAIEFLVDAVPEQGLIVPVVRNLHAILMQDLLADAESLGAIRKKLVNIRDTSYTPSQVPALLEEMLDAIVARARSVNNPIEAAFFLWVNIAYLQPFEDGNKRTSRLSANIPLLLFNCAPLSFLDVDVDEYSYAMLGIYERQDPALAVELFKKMYERSIKKYAVTLEAHGAPDQFRVRHRQALTVAVQAIVRDRTTFAAAMVASGVAKSDQDRFAPMLREELAKLTVNNCARYQLTFGQTAKWIEEGRVGEARLPVAPLD